MVVVMINTVSSAATTLMPVVFLSLVYSSFPIFCVVNKGYDAVTETKKQKENKFTT